MKLFRTTCFVHAKSTCAIALCTALAIVAAQADDQKSGSSSQDSKSQSQSHTQGQTSQQDQGQGGAGSATGSQAGSSGQLSKTDQKFIKEAAADGKQEVQMGKLGVEKASNEQVKQFAQRLLDDHKKASQELKQLATSKGISMPAEESTTPGQESERTRVREQTEESKDHQHHAMMQRLQGLSGAEFDREFVRMAVQHHEKDVKEFEKAAQRSEDPEVKAFAQKTAPILREHLQQARSLQSQVGGETGTGAPGSSNGGTSTGTGSSQSSGSTDAHTGEGRPQSTGSSGSGSGNTK